jgi:two-component system phosphate regulon sensor histidine kinase PhoR
MYAATRSDEAQHRMWTVYGAVMKTRLFYKLFGTYLVIAVLSLAVAGFFIERELKTGLTQWIENDLMSEAQIIALMPEKAIENLSQALAERSRARITLIDARGRVTLDSDGQAKDTDSHLNRPEIQEARVKGKGTATRLSRTLKTDTLYVVLPLYDGAQLKGYLRLSRPLLEVARSVNELRFSIFQVLLFIIILSMVIAFVFSMKVISPIQELEIFTDKIRKGDVSGMLMIDSRDEIGQLSKNINEMVAELQEKIRVANDEKWKLRAAFASMAEGIMVLDSQNRIEGLNKGMTEMIGHEYADIVGKTPLETFRNIELQNVLNRFRQEGQPVLQEITLGDDKPLILDVRISAVKSLPGEEPKTMMVFHDVTRLKKLERTRVDFVANVTHEIKTPLTAIIGFVETLEQGAIEDPATAKKFLQTIRENARRLNRLVDDLLVLSDVELGETKLDLEGLDIADILERALMLIAAKAFVKNVSIGTDLSPALPLIHADRDKAVQILLNVLDNAVKFTPEGGQILIRASEEKKDFMTVRITDTGPGIPKSEIPRLGERFYRVDKMRSRDMGGTGLGLSIVKHLMKAHAGEMEIESTPGKGTTVSLNFPIFQ